MIQRPKWESVGAHGPVYPHIMKEPSKMVMQKRKERVDVGDIMHHVRNNPDRISDSIQQFARGVNPAVSVSYSDGTTGVSYNPYKLNGAFRPPIRRQEDLLPLSRMPYGTTSAATNPDGNYRVHQPIEHTLDRAAVTGAVRPTFAFEGGKVDIDTPAHLLQDPLFASASAAPSFNLRPHAQAIEPINLQNPVYTSAVAGARLTINVRASPDGDLNSMLQRRLEVQAHSGYKSDYVEHVPVEVSTGIIIRPDRISANSTATAPTLVRTQIDTHATERFTQDRPLVSYLTPTFSVVLAQQDGSAKPIPLNMQQRLQVAAAANANAPLQLPIDIGIGEQYLKDYNWMIHQATPTSPMQLYIIPNVVSDGHLIQQDQVKYSVGSGVSGVIHKTHQPDVNLRETLGTMSANALPSYTNRSDAGNRDQSYERLRDTRRAAYIDPGSRPTMDRFTPTKTVGIRDERLKMGQIKSKFQQYVR